MRVAFIHPDGRRTIIVADAGKSLMEAAVTNGIAEIVGECGGSAMCATCHVYVAEEWLPKLPEIAGIEEVMLDSTAAPRCAGSRLSCQIPLSDDLDGITVSLPKDQY